MKLVGMLSILLFLTFALYANAKLLFTVMIVRHGARDPHVPYNKIFERYNKQFTGYRMLTNVGMRQHHILGRMFHDRYRNKMDISPESIIVRSTVRDRTYMSGFSFIQGLTFQQEEESIMDIETPITVSDLAKSMLNETYPKLKNLGKYAIYHDKKIYDAISYAFKPTLCPGLQYVLDKHEPKCKAIREKAVELVKPTMIDIFGKDFLDDGHQKLQNVRYGVFYNFFPKNHFTGEEIKNMDEGRRLFTLSKGYAIHEVHKTAGHHFFHQLLTAFDYAIARDRIGDENMQRIALSYYKSMAMRDVSLMPRYKWLKHNPTLVNSLQAIIYQNHDDLINNLLRGMTSLPDEDIITPFASQIIFELHKKEIDGKTHYNIHVEFDSKSLKVLHCPTGICSLSDFIKSIRKRGMFINDLTWATRCLKNGLTNQ